jgi:hypothetical protein
MVMAESEIRSFNEITSNARRSKSPQIKNRMPGGRNFAESAPFTVQSGNSNRQFNRQ